MSAEKLIFESLEMDRIIPVRNGLQQTLAQSIPLQNIRQLPPELLEGDRIQPGHPLFGLIWINRARVSGTPCFYATRVPVKTLFDCLAGGETLADFLDGFEGVSREQAIAVLELAGKDLLADLKSL